MKKSIIAMMLLVLTLMLASCARIKTNVTVYNPTDANLKGGTYAYMLLDNQLNDPHYAYISSLVDAKLQADGMVKTKGIPQYNVVIIYQLAANSPTRANSLEIAIFNAVTMYDLHSKPVYLVNVMSDGKPKDQNPDDVLAHMVNDALKNFPDQDGKIYSYPENY